MKCKNCKEIIGEPKWVGDEMFCNNCQPSFRMNKILKIILSIYILVLLVICAVSTAVFGWQKWLAEKDRDYLLEITCQTVQWENFEQNYLYHLCSNSEYTITTSTIAEYAEVYKKSNPIATTTPEKKEDVLIFDDTNSINLPYIIYENPPPDNIYYSDEGAWWEDEPEEVTTTTPVKCVPKCADPLCRTLTICP